MSRPETPATGPDAPPKTPRGQTVRPENEPLGPRDEAAPGTPGTGDDIDPKTGERFTEGIGGA